MQVFTAGISLLCGLLLARWLGPSAKGEYYLVVILPPTIMVLIQLGLPQAFGYYTARGQTRGAITSTLTLTGILSLPALGATLALLPLLRETFLRGPDPTLIIVGLLTIPLALNATMTTGIVVGRQAVRQYAAVQASVSLGGAVLLALLVGVLRLSVPGAVATFLLVSAMQALGFLLAAVQVTREVVEPVPISYRQLLRFGLPLWPGGLTLYFSYRADVYLLAWLLASPSAPLGYYSLAVSLAEMVFYVPNAVATLFFPRVASSPREASDREVAMVTRVTLLLTGMAGLALAPVGTLLVVVLLPAFTPSLPAFYVLLPGVVALSITKVLSGYVSGLGRTGLTSTVNACAFGLNVVANLLLIPRFGIVGAAAASLLSYSASSLAFTFISSRLARAPGLDFWMPRVADLRLAVGSVVALAQRARPHGAPKV
jgi:O-antigen/teichoic acid export membrane protein